jgi:hypothetical protein
MTMTISIPPGASTLQKEQSTASQEKNITDLPARFLMNPEDILTYPYSLTPQTSLNIPTSQSDQNTLRLRRRTKQQSLSPVAQSPEYQPFAAHNISTIIAKKKRRKKLKSISPPLITTRTQRYNHQETAKKKKTERKARNKHATKCAVQC